MNLEYSGIVNVDAIKPFVSILFCACSFYVQPCINSISEEFLAHACDYQYILYLLWILLKHHFYFISYKKVQIMISKMDLDGSVFFIQGSYFLFLEIITSRYFQIAYYTFLILKNSNLLEFLFFSFVLFFIHMFLILSP